MTIKELKDIVYEQANNELLWAVYIDRLALEANLTPRPR